MRYIKLFEEYLNEKVSMSTMLAGGLWGGDETFSSSDVKFIDTFVNRNIDAFKKMNFEIPFADEHSDFWKSVTKDKDYEKFKNTLNKYDDFEWPS